MRTLRFRPEARAGPAQRAGVQHGIEHGGVVDIGTGYLDSDRNTLPVERQPYAVLRRPDGYGAVGFRRAGAGYATQ